MVNVLFVGALDYPNIPKAGDAIKNRLLLDWLRRSFQTVDYIDTQRWRTNPLVLCRLLFRLLFSHIDNIVISTSNESAYRIIRILDKLNKKESKLFYFMIGGYTPIKIKQGVFKVEPFRKIDCIVVEADKVKEFYREVGLDNTYRVYNFKSTQYFADVAEPHIGPFRFVFLSRLTELKGVFHILESARRLNAEGLQDSFQVDFYGRIDVDIKERFIRELESIPNVNYKQFLDLRDDANYDILASYDTMLFPTMHPTEGFPGAIVDAAIAGLPVIAANWNYAKELVEDTGCGFVFPVGDNDALTKLMAFSISNREKIQEMRKTCVLQSKYYRTDYVLTADLIRNLGMKM